MHVFRELLHTYSILVFTKLSTPAKYALSFLGFAFMKFCQDVKLSFAYHFRKYVKASRKEDTRAKNHRVDITEGGFQGGVSSTPFGIPFHIPEYWPIHNFHITSSERLQAHFSTISTFVWGVFYLKKNAAFKLISFAVHTY